MIVNDRKTIEQFALTELSGLITLHAFRGPIIVRENMITSLTYLKGNIGVELELDWRDFYAFLLIVRLENGKIPKGYYVSGGLKCREHLANIIREQSWRAPVGPRCDKGVRKRVTVDDLKQMITCYKKQLFACLKNLETAGEGIWA